jgi:ketosteroid isomerase-like protein
MSEENVEIIRRAFEAWTRGEFWGDDMDPEIEWDNSAYPGLDIPVRGRGRENFIRLMDNYDRAWTDHRGDPEGVVRRR